MNKRAVALVHDDVWPCRRLRHERIKAEIAFVGRPGSDVRRSVSPGRLENAFLCYCLRDGHILLYSMYLPNPSGYLPTPSSWKEKGREEEKNTIQSNQSNPIQSNTIWVARTVVSGQDNTSWYIALQQLNQLERAYIIPISSLLFSFLQSFTLCSIQGLRLGNWCSSTQS